MTRVGLQHWEPQALKDWIKCAKCNGLACDLIPNGDATEKCPDCGGTGIVEASKRESSI